MQFPFCVSQSKTESITMELPKEIMVFSKLTKFWQISSCLPHYPYRNSVHFHTFGSSQYPVILQRRKILKSTIKFIDKNYKIFTNVLSYHDDEFIKDVACNDCYVFFYHSTCYLKTGSTSQAEVSTSTSLATSC